MVGNRFFIVILNDLIPEIKKRMKEGSLSQVWEQLKESTRYITSYIGIYYIYIFYGVDFNLKVTTIKKYTKVFLKNCILLVWYFIIEIFSFIGDIVYTYIYTFMYVYFLDKFILQIIGLPTPMQNRETYDKFLQASKISQESPWYIRMIWKIISIIVDVLSICIYVLTIFMFFLFFLRIVAMFYIVFNFIYFIIDFLIFKEIQCSFTSYFDLFAFLSKNTNLTAFSIFFSFCVILRIIIFYIFREIPRNTESDEKIKKKNILIKYLSRCLFWSFKKAHKVVSLLKKKDKFKHKLAFSGLFSGLFSIRHHDILKELKENKNRIAYKCWSDQLGKEIEIEAELHFVDSNYKDVEEPEKVSMVEIYFLYEERSFGRIEIDLKKNRLELDMVGPFVSKDISIVPLPEKLIAELIRDVVIKTFPQFHSFFDNIAEQFKNGTRQTYPKMALVADFELGGRTYSRNVNSLEFVFKPGPRSLHEQFFIIKAFCNRMFIIDRRKLDEVYLECIDQKKEGIFFEMLNLFLAYDGLSQQQAIDSPINKFIINRLDQIFASDLELRNSFFRVIFGENLPEGIINLLWIAMKLGTTGYVYKPGDRFPIVSKGESLLDHVYFYYKNHYTYKPEQRLTDLGWYFDYLLFCERHNLQVLINIQLGTGIRVSWATQKVHPFVNIDINVASEWYTQWYNQFF